MPRERTRRVGQSANRFGATTRIKRTCVDGQPCTHEHAGANVRPSDLSPAAQRRTHPRATADRKARPPARDANGDARARTSDQFVRNALRRSLARLRSDEDPGRAASASSSDDRTLAKGGFGGCPRRRHPPSARARAVSGGFFFLLFAVLPDRDFAISRDRDLARDGWRRRSRESRESRYGSFQSSDWSRLEPGTHRRVMTSRTVRLA